MKKVAILYSGSRNWGGIDSFLLSLFGNYSKEKIKLILLSIGNWPVCEEVKNIGGRVEIYSGTRFRPKTIFEIRQFLKAEKVDVLVSGGVVANAYGRLAVVHTGIASLVVVHSFFEDEYSGLIRTCYRIIDRALRPITNKYIAVSKAIREELIKTGIHSEKIELIYNGVHFKPIKSSASLNSIGSIGRLSRLKGYENLIGAISKLPPQTHLTIWGEGDERKELQDLISKLNLSNRVKLAGYSNNIWESLSGVGLYVQPSLSEGFGLTVVEAMAAGKPVIITPTGGLTEIVRDGETGIITKDYSSDSIAQAIKKAMGEPQKLIQMAQKGQVFAKENFDVKNWAKKVEDTFLEVAQPKAGKLK